MSNLTFANYGGALGNNLPQGDNNNAASHAIGHAVMGAYQMLTQNAGFQPLTWTEDGMACSATYNGDSTVATMTKNGVKHTYTYDGAGHLLTVVP